MSEMPMMVHAIDGQDLLLLRRCVGEGNFDTLAHRLEAWDVADLRELRSEVTAFHAAARLGIILAYQELNAELSSEASAGDRMERIERVRLNAMSELGSFVAYLEGCIDLTLQRKGETR